MRWCVTQKQMQDFESDAINRVGIPSIVLMERAALAVVDVVKQYVDKSQEIQIVCGKGNNGADGVAVGRLLHQAGYRVLILTIGSSEKATREYKIQEQIARNLNIPFVSWQAWNPNEKGWVIDAIFGIGLTRDIGGEYQQLIERIQQYDIRNIIAIDIPSGISADTGAVLGCALVAKHTVTFGYGKVGIYLGAGNAHAGVIHVADIGFPIESLPCMEGSIAKVIEEIDLVQIPERCAHANKGTYGKLLLIAGSPGMSGAAYLSALAAYRMGAGLVKILTTEENCAILQMQLPEAIVQGYTKENLEEVVPSSCDWATSIVMGPGLGQGDYVPQLVECVMKQVGAREKSCPLVLDSDALNTIANQPYLRQYYGSHVIVTPHMKEMSRLTQVSIPELKAEPVPYARAYSEAHQVTCVLKDAVTVTTNACGDTYLTLSGNSALAKGGTGDVLTGIIGGLTCLGLYGVEAASFGSFLHGRAGSRASEVRGKHGVLASELLEYLTV